MITETHLDCFNQKLRYEKHKVPYCSCKGDCPKFYFNLLACGSRGVGKSYQVSQLIKHYESNDIIDENGLKKELRTFIISPTIDQNKVFTALKSIDFENDVYEDYSDDILKGILEEIKSTKKESEDFSKYKEAYKRYIKLPEEKLYKLDNEDLMLLSAKDFLHWSEIEQPKYENPPVNIILMDDLIGSACYGNKKQNYFTKMLCKNRHDNVMYCILVQSIKSVPKSVRLNCNLYWLGRFSNVTKVVEDIYEEISNCITEEGFLEMYLHATDQPYGSLVVDMTDGKKFRLGWDTELKYEK